MINRFLTYAVFLLVLSSGCSSQIAAQTEVLKTGASRTELYVPQIKDKRVALVVNNTSLLDGRHLLDTLLAREINVVKVFAPEHGLRGDADAGEKTAHGVDTQCLAAAKREWPCAVFQRGYALVVLARANQQQQVVHKSCHL